MREFTVAVVGAGASGLMAARKAGFALKRHGGTVILLEGNQKPGKKLLATGNGRCNLTNLNITPKNYHGEVREMEGLLSRYPPQRVLAEFEKMGLICREESQGRVYPGSLQAAGVLQALRQSCHEAGVLLECDFEVTSVKRRGGGFEISSSRGDGIYAKACILACGGMASPKHSCDEKGYTLAGSLGHRVNSLSPSLAPLKSPCKMLKALKGMRCKAEAALVKDGRVVRRESGEVLFGEGAVSGICIFNLSPYVKADSGQERSKWEVSLDLLEAMTLPEVLDYLQGLRKNHPEIQAGELFSGALNLRVGRELVKSLKIARDIPLKALRPPELEKAAALVKGLVIPISGVGSWDSAQVTSGGVPLSEINMDKMESKLQPGLFFAGELLDIHGDCGGYNLHWAWATGMAAGAAAAKRGISPEGGKQIC